MNVNDIIQKDPRVVALKQQFNHHVQKRNELIVEISLIESDIIRRMGQFEIVDHSLDAELLAHLKAEFKALAGKKANAIAGIAGVEDEINKTKGQFELLAEAIVDELRNPKPQSGQCKCEEPGSCDVCKCESSPEDACDNGATDRCCKQGECKKNAPEQKEG